MNEASGQWDATAQRLIDFAGKARFEALSGRAVHETKRRLIDTFASALGAYDEPVGAMARAAAQRYRGEPAARVWGSNIETVPEMAAFANGVMTRALDVSDTYLGRSRGHPSDMTPGLVALAEIAGADGKALINAICLAYDVYCSFCRHVDINARGWDQPVYAALGCALGASKLLSLTPEQTGHALALALTPNMALAQARRGSLSSWKGCAGANGARNAVFAAQLAQQGFTGPMQVFEGSGGLWEAVGEPDWPLPEESMIVHTHTKSLPVCYHGQSAVLAALEMRDEVNVADIAAIHVDGYDMAVFMMGADRNRWAPDTRETADHSLPYCIALALVDGTVTRASFESQRLRDPALGALMQKTTVAEDPGLTSWYPEGAPGRLTIRLNSGKQLTREIRYPRGHEKDPMSDDEIERKFHDFCAGRLDAVHRQQALDALWRADAAPAVAEITRLFAVAD